jgi:Domain of unknown function (DUF4783)
MRLSTKMAFLLVFVPLVASAQFRNLDVALSNLTRGFGSGDPQAIVAGMASGDQVMLQFPGLIEQSGFFGRDQAAYLLDGLFSKVHPTSFEQQNAKKVSAESQYHITGTWTIQNGGKPETRNLYITLHNKDDLWSVVSIRSAGK